MRNISSERMDTVKMIKTFIYLMAIISCWVNTSHALTQDQHSKLLGREDYKLSYEFFQEELNNIEKLLSIQKYEKLSADILRNIDLEVKYVQETHPFYDRERMYAIIFASKALQLKWLEGFLKENKNYTQEQFEKFVKDINITNVYNFVAKTMETPDGFSITNDLPIQCNYEKDFSDWNKKMVSASKWLYSISLADPTFFSLIAGAVLNAGAFVDRQEFRCHFRANVTKAKVHYFYKGMLSDFYQIENQEIGKKQFATGIEFNTHTVKSNLFAIGIATTQKINGKNVDKFIIYKIDRENKDLVLVDTKHFVEQIMPHFKKD